MLTCTEISSIEKVWAALKRAFGFVGGSSKRRHLTSEAVQSASLPLQSIDDIHGGHGLSLGVLGVGDGVTDHVLQEHLEDTAGLLVDQAGDALHAAAASQTADGGLGDSLDVITEHLAMTLGASFSESLSTFAPPTHFFGSVVAVVLEERMISKPEPCLFMCDLRT